MAKEKKTFQGKYVLLKEQLVWPDDGREDV